MPQFNFVDLPAIDQASQRTQINAFNIAEAKKTATRKDTEYDDKTRLKNTRWLAASTQLLMEINEKNPDRFYEAVDELSRVGIERGIIDGEKFDPALATPEAIQAMHDDAMIQLGQNKIRSDDPSKSSRQQNYEVYSGLNPQQQRDWQDSNAAAKAMKTVKVLMPDGTEIMVNYDPQTGQGYDLISGKTMIVRPGDGGQPMVYSKEGLIGPGQLTNDQSQAPPGFGMSQSPADKKRAELTVAKEFDRELEVDSALVGLNKALRLGPVIKRALDAVSWNNTGFMSIFNFIPGLTGNDLEADLQTITANLGFGELAEMRRTSKTGGAVGQLSEKELVLLSAMLRNLNTSQTYEQLHSNLRDVLLQYDKWAKAYGKDIAEFGTEEQFQEYFEMLPSGTAFTGPDGENRVKP